MMTPVQNEKDTIAENKPNIAAEPKKKEDYVPINSDYEEIDID